VNIRQSIRGWPETEELKDRKARKARPESETMAEDEALWPAPGSEDTELARIIHGGVDFLEVSGD